VEVHSAAKELIKSSIMKFGTSLLLQSKIIAFQRNDGVVLKSHVDEALEMIQQERKQKFERAWSGAAGGVIFGAFVQGIIAELAGKMNPAVVAIYIILGLLGLILIFVGLGYKR
jgi:hypothetical protein